MKQQDLVFLIEGELDRRRTIGSLLLRMGLEVEIARSREQALQRLRGRRPVAFLLDLGLPAEEALEFLRLLSSDPKARKIPVVGLVERERMAAVGPAREVGLAAHIVRPVLARELIATLNRVVGRELAQVPVGAAALVNRGEEVPPNVPAVQGSLGPPTRKKTTAGEAGRLLLIDDDLGHLRPLRIGLLRSGFQVQTVRDGAEGLLAVREDPPDVIVLDLEMPGLDGLSFLERLRSGGPAKELPVIVLTGLTDPQHRAAALSAGANQYLTKPVEIRDLLRTILQVRSGLPS